MSARTATAWLCTLLPIGCTPNEPRRVSAVAPLQESTHAAGSGSSLGEIDEPPPPQTAPLDAGSSASDAGKDARSSPTPARRTSCRASLGSFCAKERCRPYDATRAAAEKNLTPPSDSGLTGLEIEVEVGACGRWRFVRHGDTYSGWTQFFDASGKIVGASRWSDTNSFCAGTAYSIEYGIVPDECR